jgi:hypothetical protein
LQNEFTLSNTRQTRCTAATNAGHQGVCRLTLGALCWSSATDVGMFMRQTRDISVCRCYAVGISASRCDRRGHASIDVSTDASVVAPSILDPYWRASDARRTLRLKALDASDDLYSTIGFRVKLDTWRHLV